MISTEPAREAQSDNVTAAQADYARRQEAADWLRFCELENLGDRCASYWRSLAEAASRNEERDVKAYCTRIAIMTKAAFNLAKTLGTPPGYSNSTAKASKADVAAQ